MLGEEDLKILREIPLFERLPEEKLLKLIGGAQPKEYPKGQVLFCRGEPSVCFYVVMSGWVKIYRETAEGDEAVLGVFTKGESLGEAAAFIGIDYPASCQIVENSRLLPILSAPFSKQVSIMPEVAMSMLGSISQKLHYHISEIEKLKTLTATHRVVDFLLKLCSVEEGSAVVFLPYDKTLLSRRLGIQPESLSRILGKLRSLGVKTEHSRVIIADVSQLTDFSNEQISIRDSKAQTV